MNKLKVMKLNKIAVIGIKGLPSAGGTASVGESLIKRLCLDYNFSIYLMKSKSTETKLQNRNIEYIIVNDTFLMGSGKIIPPLYYYIYSTVHLLFTSNHDLVHIHNRDSAFVLPFLSIKYKTIVTLHGTNLTDKWQKYDFIFKIFDKLVVKFSSGITSVSAVLYSKVYTNNNKPRFIPNGVESYSMYRGNSEKKNNSKQIICFAAGRILKTKGLHILLEALLESNFDYEVWVFGNIDFESKYGSYIKHLSKKVDCHFHGMINDKESLLKTIGKSSLFVYPSYIETMSMMLLEVASLGVPIICADIIENKNLFSNNEVLFFKSESKGSLLQAINFAFNDMDLLHEKSLLAMNKVAKDHDWNDIVLTYSDFYEEVLNHE